MIRIGEYQFLEIMREKPQGFYLEDETYEEEVLIPRAYITDDMKIGDMVEVLVYYDSHEREIATTEKAILTAGEFALLEVKQVNTFGAFADWGVSKQLIIPFRNQLGRLNEGQSYVVHMYLDSISDRLVGTTKLKRFLEFEAGEDIVKGQEVDLLVYHKTDIGYQVIINQAYSGMIYHNEIPQNIKIGDELKGYIKPIRPDGKIDVSLTPIGHQSIEPNANKILEKLKANDGFLPFTDKSDPDAIRDEFGISKKLFKKAIGNLYKQKLIRLEVNGIYIK